MILDTSAIVALLLAEPESDRLEAMLAAFPSAGVGTPTLVEAGIVLLGKAGVDGRRLLVEFVDQAEIVGIRFNEAHWRAAVSAHSRFGKGRHRARLNFGDCMAYAVAIHHRVPLLFKGDDFTHTDVTPALARMVRSRWSKASGTTTSESPWCI